MPRFGGAIQPAMAPDSLTGCIRDSTKARIVSRRALGSHPSRFVRHVASSKRVPSGPALRLSSLNEGRNRNPGEPFSQVGKPQYEHAE